MFYRENGQFKTSYKADEQIFPIRQDRIAITLLLVLAFVVVPFTASEYLLRAILIPFLLEGVAADPKLNLEDGIHPNADGHKIVAENVWKVLAPLLRK